MISGDAENTLRSMLSAAGVDLSQVTTDDIDDLWAVYRAFAELPVSDAAPADEDGDMLLAQWGCSLVYEGYDFQNPIGERFYFDITRQFSFHDRNDEYCGMAQLQCELSLEVSDTLKAVRDANFWNQGDLDSFFARAKVTPGYTALRQLPAQPLAVKIAYSSV